jgi:hypothetical protein
MPSGSGRATSSLPVLHYGCRIFHLSPLKMILRGMRLMPDLAGDGFILPGGERKIYAEHFTDHLLEFEAVSCACAHTCAVGAARADTGDDCNASAASAINRSAESLADGGAHADSSAPLQSCAAW